MKSPFILVIRRDDQFSEYLRENGCRVRNLELIRTAPADNLTEFTAKLVRLDEFDGLFITSPAAAEVFVRQLDEGAQKFTGKVYVLGARAKDVLDAAGLNVVFNPSANAAEDLVTSFDPAEFAGKRLLFVRGDKSVRTIPTMLGSSARIEEAEVYRTVDHQPDAELLESVRGQLERSEIDWTCFFSPSGVESFMRSFVQEPANYPAIAVIGETTARSVRAEGLTVDYVSPKANALEFAKDLIEHIKNH